MNDWTQADVEQLEEKVATLEELQQIYEQSATEQEQQLQAAFKTLEEKARQLEHAQSALQTLETILESMGDAVLVVDKKEHVLFSNSAAKQLLNSGTLTQPRPKDSLPVPQFQTAHDQVSGFYEENSVCVIKVPSIDRAIAGELIDNAEMQVAIPHTDQPCWLSTNARPLKSEQQIIGAVAVFRDITQSKQFEQALKLSNKEFQEQSQVLENTLKELQKAQMKLIHEEKMSGLAQTVAGIAHEINNPVGFIHGNIRPLREAVQDLMSLVSLFRQTYTKLTPDIREKIEAIDLDFLASDLPRIFYSMETGTERIRGIVNSLRVFSRLDEAEVKAVDIHQGIDSVCMVLQSRFQEKPNRSSIRINKAYGDIPLLECHASQMNQVFAHLLSNAIDAIDRQPDPEISICTQAIDNQVIIQISDNGSGIPKEIQNRVFNPFFTTKPVGSGTGLGLSVCHQIIVEVHQGSINITSEEGQGTCVEIVIPKS